jgi:hypothetical protein
MYIENMFVMPNVLKLLTCTCIFEHAHAHCVHTHKHNCKLYFILYLIKRNYYNFYSKFVALIIYYVQRPFSTCKNKYI